MFHENSPICDTTIHARFCGRTRWAMMRESLFCICITSFRFSFSSIALWTFSCKHSMRFKGITCSLFDSIRPVLSHSPDRQSKKNSNRDPTLLFWQMTRIIFKWIFFLFTLLLLVSLRLYRKLRREILFKWKPKCWMQFGSLTGNWTNDFRFYFQHSKYLL